MKTAVNESKNPLFKKLGITGLSLCLICCAIPIIGTVTASGILSSIAFYMEKIALGALFTSAGLFGLWYFTRKKAPLAKRLAILI
jgi:hypothetical protein